MQKRKHQTFSDRVYKVVSKIPKGKTLTYKEVAKLAGSPRAFRAVGNVLNKNYDSQIPCHRVVRSDGTPGGYNRGRRTKQKLLKEELASATARARGIFQQKNIRVRVK